MARFLDYAPEQAWLLPPRLSDELGEDHLACFIHECIEQLNLSAFEAAYSEDGRPAYPPELMLKVWLYAYTLDVTSSRRLEQRIREDLGFRYLAGSLKPDHWTLNEFRRRHRRAINDVFTQVVETARKLGLGKLGSVAIDSTRVAANASPDRKQTIEQVRKERARIRQRIRRWYQRCNRDDDAGPGESVEPAADWRRRLEEIPKQLEELRKSGREQGSKTDPESRYLRRRGGFCLGYTAELAVSEDHFIVAQRVHQAATDHESLAGMTQAVERECGERPKAVLADCGYHQMGQIAAVEASGVETYVPDQLLARELAGKAKARAMNKREQRRYPGLQQRRERLRSPAARAMCAKRKALVEPVFGVLKQQRGMRQFRCRGLAAVGVEWALAATAFNLTRMFAQRRKAA
jgi:transposase